MRKTLAVIILLGLFFGVLAAAMTMLLGIIVYYSLESLEIFISMHFLNYAAWLSMGIGLFFIFAWYIYILLIARKYFFRIVDEFIGQFKEVKK